MNNAKKAAPVAAKKITGKKAEFQTKLESIETASALSKLIADAKKAGLKIVNKTSGTPLDKFEKVKGKTKADAISYATQRKIRVAFVHRYFTVK